MTCEGEVESSDYRGFGTDGGVCVVIRGVYEVTTREGIRRGHL